MRVNDANKNNLYFINGGFMKKTLLVLLMALIMPVLVNASEKDYMGEINLLLNSDSILSTDDEENAVLTLIIDAGPSIIPDLEKIILSEGKNAPWWSRLALAAFGDADSVDILQIDYKPEEVVQMPIERAVCLAKAARGNKEDIAFLIKLMSERGHFWNDINAALNLAVIRANEAIPVLKSTIEKDPRRLYEREALEMITVPVQVDVRELNNPAKEIIAAIFKNGIPFLQNIEDEVRDSKNNGVWKREGNTWIFIRNLADEAVHTVDVSKSHTVSISPVELLERLNSVTYRVDFDVHISPDNERAFVFVDHRHSSYIYVLEKKDSFWKVRWMYVRSMV